MTQRIVLMLNRNKWWIFIGAITSIIFSVITYFFWEKSQQQGMWVGSLILQSLLLFLVSGIVAELMSKSEKAIRVGVSAIFTAIYEFIIYLLIFWIGFLIVVQRTWEDVMFAYNAGFTVFYPLLFMIVAFIPMNLVGGFLVFGIRKLVTQRK